MVVFWFEIVKKKEKGSNQIVQLGRTFGRSKQERLDRKAFGKRERRSRKALKLSLAVENGASIFVLFIDLSTLKLSYLNLHVSVLSTSLHCLFTVLSGFWDRNERKFLMRCTSSWVASSGYDEAWYKIVSVNDNFNHLITRIWPFFTICVWWILNLKVAEKNCQY